VRSDKLIASLDKASLQWSYISRFFRLDSYNTSFRPALMPLISYLTFATNIIPPIDTISKFVLASPWCKTSDVEPRVYQCYTAWLRELHCGLYLAQYGKVTKNPKLDLCAGVDWVFNGKIKIAVAHNGFVSRQMMIRRKKRKMSEDVVILTAQDTGTGLHLVTSAEMDAKILNISASSSSTCLSNTT